MGDILGISSAGMRAQQSAMGNNAANLANGDTLGYMTVESNFVTQVTGQQSSVTMYSRNNFTEPGSITMTGRELDLATNGQGFFPVKGPDGIAYKKTSSCEVDNQGFLIDEAGNKMLGVPLNPNGTLNGSFTTAALVPVKVDMGGNIAGPTSNLTISANLPANAINGFSQPIDADVYDTLGMSHTVRLNWTKTATPLEWKLDISAPNENPALPAMASQTLLFDNKGFPTGWAPPPLTFAWGNGSAPANIAVNLGTTGKNDGMTMLGKVFSLGTVTQDGSGFGSPTGIQVGKDGKVGVIYDNGMNKPLFQLPLASFVAVNELKRASGNLLEETRDSGPAMLNEAGTDRAGDILTKCIVGSATDQMSDQVELIEESQLFSANSGAFAIGRDTANTLNDLMRGR